MVAIESLAIYIILGAVIGIVWSLRKIYIVEARLVSLDLKTEKLVEKTERLVEHLSKKK